MLFDFGEMCLCINSHELMKTLKHGFNIKEHGFYFCKVTVADCIAMVTQWACRSVGGMLHTCSAFSYCNYTFNCSQTGMKCI